MLTLDEIIQKEKAARGITGKLYNEHSSVIQEVEAISNKRFNNQVPERKPVLMTEPVRRGYLVFKALTPNE